MLRQVWSEGLDPRYVTGDTLYGNSSPLRRFLAEHEQVYVLQIGSKHRVTVDGARMSLSQIAEEVPAEPWEKFSFTVSEKGPIWYEWRRLRVEMPTDELGEQWLLLRRSPNAPEDVDFFVSNADPQVPLTELAAAAGMRHEIEQTFQEAKSELGLADYEVRTWHGWHRHMTLCILAHTWLTLLSHPSEKKSHLPRFLSFSLAEWRALGNILFPLPSPTFQQRLRWFWWRRHHRLRAAAARLGIPFSRVLQLGLPP